MSEQVEHLPLHLSFILNPNGFTRIFILGLVGAPACGDVMKLQFETDDNGVITNAVFKTFGCGSAIGKKNFSI